MSDLSAFDQSMAMPEFHFDEDSGLEPLVLFPGPLLVGRDEDCDRQIRHKKVSKRHARVERDDDVWFIEDAGSTNGTFVNGVSCETRQPMYHDDVIKLGGLYATFHAPNVQPPPPEAPARFQRSATAEAVTETSPLDVRASTVRAWAGALWLIVGIVLALFVYLAVLYYLHPPQADARTPSWQNSETDAPR